MSILWAVAIACILIAVCCCRVVILARFKIGVVPDWLGPALFVAMLVVAGVLLVAERHSAW
jgi:hypothetical protein